MPRKNYEPVLAEVKRKILENRDDRTDKPAYRFRLIFKDTSFLREVAEEQAKKAK